MCNCGGSTRRTPQQVRKAVVAAGPAVGGPGEPGYTWNGPGKKAAAPEPAVKK